VSECCTESLVGINFGLHFLQTARLISPISPTESLISSVALAKHPNASHTSLFVGLRLFCFNGLTLYMPD